MGGDHIAKDEDLDLTETEMEMVQFVLLSIITKPHTSSSERAHKYALLTMVIYALHIVHTITVPKLDCFDSSHRSHQCRFQTQPWLFSFIALVTMTHY